MWACIEAFCGIVCAHVPTHAHEAALHDLGGTASGGGVIGKCEMEFNRRLSVLGKIFGRTSRARKAGWLGGKRLVCSGSERPERYHLREMAKRAQHEAEGFGFSGEALICL